jgi:hypothetical protein
MGPVHLSKPILLHAATVALLIEIVTLPIAILTMGHAGPEGSLATIGWIGLFLNLPGFFIAGYFAPFGSQLAFALLVFLIQMIVVTTGFYLIKRRFWLS